MSEQTKEIKKLAGWCQKAREIIGKGVQGDSRKMEQQIDHVEKMLKSLSKQTGDSDKELFEAGMNGFRALTQDHQRLTQAYDEAVAVRKNAKSKADKERADAAVTLAREKVRGLMTKMADFEQDLVADAPLAKAVHFFEISVRNAEVLIRNEQQRERANVVELKGALDTLARWKQDVETDERYRVPSAVDGLTQQIKPLLQRLIRESGKESSELRKGDERQSLARGDAEQRLKEAEALLKELTESGQLVPSIGTQLRTTISEVGLLHAQEKWIEGAEQLKKLPSREKCVEAFRAAGVEASVDFGSDLEQCRVALAALKEQADTVTWQRFDGENKRLQGRAGDPARKIKDNAKLLADLRSHLAAMKAELKFGVEASGRIVTQLDELGRKAEALVPVAPLNRIEENRRQIELITVLQGERRWREAEDTVRLLQAAMVQQANPDFEQWKRVGPVLRGRPMLNDLRMAIGNPGATPALKASAQQLLDRIAGPRLAALENTRDWSALVALYVEADKFVLGLTKDIQNYKDFAGARDEADRMIKPRQERCASSMVELERAVTQAGGDPAPVLKPLKARYDELANEWKGRLASAAEAADLGADEMMQELNLLMQAILSANYGKNVEEAVEGQREAAGQAVFDKALLALERDGLAALALLSVAAAADFRGEIATLSEDTGRETDPAQPWAQRVLGLQALAGRVTTAIAEAEKTCGDLNRELTGKAEAVELVLRAAKEKLKSKDILGSVAKRYEPMLKSLEDELAGLRELLKTTNATAAAGNAKLLASLKKRADDLVRLAANNDVLDNREERVENVGKRLEALRKEGLDKLAAETDGKLGDQLAQLKRDMFGLEPQLMNEALDEIDAALAEARKELDGRLAQKARVVELERDLRPRIAKLKTGGMAVPYYDKLLQRVGAAVEQAKVVDKLAGALSALDGIGTEVAQAEARNPEAGLARQKVQNSEEHAQTLLKREYERRLKTIKSRVVPRATEAVKEAGGDRGQLDEVERMLKLAVKAAESDDFERAIQTLVRTENRVAEIEKNPAGTALGDRNALPKHLETFRGQMNTLRERLGEFAAAAAGKVPEARREAVRKLLDDAVLKVKVQLNPRLFDLYVGDIANTDKPAAERRAVRDQALQRLRELRAFITTQPTVVKLADNPILPLRELLRLVDNSLTRLEAHLRAAVR